LVDDHGGNFSELVDLTEEIPDHVNNHGVIGVWKRSTGEIAVFRGSTVPNWDYMCMQTELSGHQANMLPTGRYVYQVGRHRDVDGAFRLNAEVVVLRSNDDLIYEATDDWETWKPLDNIHPGGCPDEPFSSAGCQTVIGTFGESCPNWPNVGEDRHAGPWATFRERAGLDPDYNQVKWGASFVYLLFTCREAQLASSFADLSAFNRLRFGSSGAAVVSLQNALRERGYSSVPASGFMGPDTTLAFIQWQQSQNDGAADGIVTPDLANVLGFSLDD
jgi:hypothetical protein